MAQKTRTIDHIEIQEWVGARGGRPAVLEGTFDELGGGVLRIDFGDPEGALEELTWRDFFRVFDQNELAFEYDAEDPDGTESYVYTFVSRDETVDAEEPEEPEAGVIDDF